MKATTRKSGGFAGFLNTLAENFLAAKAAKKAVEIDYNAAKAQIVQVLNGALTAETDRFAIVYASNVRETLDIERLKSEEPDTYKRFLKPTEYNVLTVHEKIAAKSRIA